jgi:hypothetical protein
MMMGGVTQWCEGSQALKRGLLQGGESHGVATEKSGSSERPVFMTALH